MRRYHLKVCVNVSWQDLRVYGSHSSWGRRTYMLPLHSCRRPGKPASEPRGLWVTDTRVHMWQQLVADEKKQLHAFLLLSAPSADTTMNCRPNYTIVACVLFLIPFLPPPPSAEERSSGDRILPLASKEGRLPVDPVHSHRLHKPQSPAWTQRHLGELCAEVSRNADKLRVLIQNRYLV